MSKIIYSRLELLKLRGISYSPAFNKNNFCDPKNKFKKKHKKIRKWIPKNLCKQNKYLLLGSWNVRSLILQKSNDICPRDKRPIVVQEARRLNLDILALSETHLLSSDNVLMDDYTLIWSGNETFRQNGVAILIKNNMLSHHVKTVNNISNRIMSIRLYINGNYLTIFSIYAPTNVADVSSKRDFYSSLKATLKAVPKTDIVLILGDLNARINFDKDIDEGSTIVGKYANSQLNENGQLLIDFCSDYHFQ